MKFIVFCFQIYLHKKLNIVQKFSYNLLYIPVLINFTCIAIRSTNYLIVLCSVQDLAQTPSSKICLASVTHRHDLRAAKAAKFRNIYENTTAAQPYNWLLQTACKPCTMLQIYAEIIAPSLVCTYGLCKSQHFVLRTVSV